MCSGQSGRQERPIPTSSLVAWEEKPVFGAGRQPSASLPYKKKNGIAGCLR